MEWLTVSKKLIRNFVQISASEPRKFLQVNRRNFRETRRNFRRNFRELVGILGYCRKILGLGLICNFDFLGPRKGVAPKPDQKVDQLVGLFGRLAILKSCFLLIAPKLHQSRNSKIEDDS